MDSQYILAFLTTGLILLALSTGTPLPEKLDELLNFTADMRSNSLDGKIINGYLAELENVKHQVSLRHKYLDRRGFGYGHICGGSLIKPQVVLSAAHCFLRKRFVDPRKVPFRDVSEFMVVMGNLDRFDRENTHYTGLLKVVMPTETFDTNTYDHDIALLLMKRPVSPHLRHIQPIELNYQPVPDGAMCTASGWGITEKGTLAKDLLCVDVPFISQIACIKDSHYHSLIIPGMICAGYIKEGEKDACVGDSGGPLVCNGLLTGIVSWGTDCGKSYKPGVYTDVEYYESWIEENVAHMATSYRNNSPHRSTNCVIFLFVLLSYFISCF